MNYLIIIINILFSEFKLSKVILHTDHAAVYRKLRPHRTSLYMFTLYKVLLVCIIFLISVLNIDFGYILGGSNEYPQSMFRAEKRKYSDSSIEKTSFLQP